MLAAHALGVHRNTIGNWLKRDPEVYDAYREILEVNIDRSEGVVLKEISEGNLQAAMFLLRHKGRERGWGDKVEYEGQLGVDVSGKVTHEVETPSLDRVADILNVLEEVGALPGNIPRLPGKTNGSGANGSGGNGSGQEKDAG